MYSANTNKNESISSSYVNGKYMQGMARVETIKIATHGTSPTLSISSSVNILKSVFTLDSAYERTSCPTSNDFRYRRNDIRRSTHFPKGNNLQCAFAYSSRDVHETDEF